MSMKEYIKSRAKISLGIPEILASIPGKIAEANLSCGLYGDSCWHSGPSYWEPPVLNALKDLCRPGDVAFDVGANMGGLTSSISRLVGPKGLVCAFEASPRIIGHLQKNVTLQGAGNVTVIHRAVFSRSNETLTIYEGNHLNDSLYQANSPTGVGSPVVTVALNDFCREVGIYPNVVKMDIEGAEYEALLGAAEVIDKAKPSLILEQSPNDARCLELLLNCGYFAINSKTYEQLRSADDLKAGPPIQDIIYIHEAKINGTPYRLPIAREVAVTMTADDFQRNPTGGFTSKPLPLKAGRYLFDVQFQAGGTDNEMFVGVRAVGGKTILRYHSFSSFLAQSYFQWMVDVSHEGIFEAFFDFLSGTHDDSLLVNGATVAQFPTISASLWSRIVLE